MSQQYPQQPHAYYPPQPQAPKKKKRGCLYAVIGAAVFVVIIVAASSNGSKGTSDTPASPATSHKAADPQAPKDPKPSSDPQDSAPIDAFKAYAKKNGTPTESAAVSHVTKVQGADGKNDLLDTADVYTNYTGGLTGGHAGDANLIASAFADWQASRGKDSKNGLVTVYDASGDLLGNGKY